MTQQEDEKRAVQLGIALDLASLVADVRAERVEHLPQDPVFLLALVLLAATFDEDELVARLAVPEEIIEAAGRCVHAEVNNALILVALKEMGNKARTKGRNDR